MSLKITADNIETATLLIIAGPKIAAITYPGNDTAVSPDGGQTVSITGSGFVTGAQVFIDGTAAPAVSFVSSTVLSITTPARSAGSYQLYVVNPDGATATFAPGIQYSGVPTWSTAAGSLGSVNESSTFTSNLIVSSDSAIVYSLTGGTLPNGLSLNANTGVITGTANTLASTTVYNFIVEANDAENQNTTRNFSISVIADSVSWSSPADGTTYIGTQGSSFTQALVATSAFGKNITYTANTLPAGLSIVGSNISGTYSQAGTTSSLVTATAADTLKTATRTINFSVTPVTLQVTYLIVAGGGGSGSDASGGGGAGGYLTGTTTINLGETYTITVGGGGSDAVGSNSSAFSLTSIGGGRGGGGAQAGSAGGSGGGGGYGGAGGLGTVGPPRQGYNGGSGVGGFRAGGGGGAGAAGSNSSGNGGPGGAGIANPISGSTIGQLSGGTYYICGGGGAGAHDAGGGAGGLGGGGAGGGTPNFGVAGTANTGGGGGGSGQFRAGANGGSGVVIVRYADSNPAASATTGSPTVAVSGGFRTYTFTSSGSITI